MKTQLHKMFTSLSVTALLVACGNSSINGNQQDSEALNGLSQEQAEEKVMAQDALLNATSEAFMENYELLVEFEEQDGGVGCRFNGEAQAPADQITDDDEVILDDILARASASGPIVDDGGMSTMRLRTDCEKRPHPKAPNLICEYCETHFTLFGQPMMWVSWSCGTGYVGTIRFLE